MYNFEEYEQIDKSVYEYFALSATGYSDKTAISYYGKTFTYNEMMKRIDEFASALKSFGVGKNDVVASSLPGMPEGVFLIYAINKIGACYCAFDCRSKSDEIKEMMNTFSPKLCFVPDFQVKEFRDVHNNTVVHISPVHCIGGLMKFSEAWANFFRGRTFFYHKHKNLISYEKFISASYCEDINFEHSDNNEFGYFYTSGTTYGRKSVILSNENINAAAIQQKKALGLIKPGDSILNIMPLFTCYSVTLGMHLPLVNGVSVSLVPLVNTKKFKNLILKHKPNYIITVPAHWEYFIKEDFDGCDLSFLKEVVIGGDIIDSGYRKSLDRIFETVGTKITVGYGLTETASSATMGRSKDIPEGSVGFAIANTDVRIYNSQSDAFMPCGGQGEICISGPTVCKGYYKDREMTEKLLKEHNGRVWLHSGDMGYIDENGALFFCERIKRMYVRFDGSKISPYSIEQAILKCPVVKRCLVVAIADVEHSHGKCAKAFVVLQEGYKKDTANKMLESFIKSNLDEHMVPKEIEFVEKLPYTKNGKLDYFGAVK